MEVFEMKKQPAEREFSTASTGRSSFSKVGYVVTMAGIVLFTSALLLVVHFTREISHFSEVNQILDELTAAKLEDQTCELPYCTTKECVSVAATMLEFLDPKVDPCTDFYRHACGNYKRVKAVPYGMRSFSPAREARMEMLIDIRKIMESPPSDREGSAMKKARKFYESCYSSRQNKDPPDVSEIHDSFENLTRADPSTNRASLSSFLENLGIVQSGYVLGDPLRFEDPQRWTDLVSKLEQYRLHTLFKPTFVKLPNAPAPEKIEIDCLVPFLDPKAYTNTSNVKLIYQKVIYRDAMLETFRLFGMDWSARNELADEILKTETDLASAALSAGPSSFSGPEGSEDTARDNTLTSLYYRTVLLKSLWLPIVGEAIQDMELVFTCENDLEDIVNAIEQTPNESMVKYIFWRMLMQLLPHLDSDFRSVHLDYLTKLPGTDYGLDVAWKECADVLRSEFGLVMAKGLLDKGFIEAETLEIVRDVFLDLKRHLAPMIAGMDIFDNDTQQGYQNKLKHMKLSFGYNNFSLTDDVLDRVYAELDLDDDYFSNAMKLKRFKARRHLAYLWYMNDGDVVMRTSLDEDPLGSNTYYDYLHNTVNINLGLLRPPLAVYSENLPGYLKFGYSSIIAREIGRAFDSKGKLIDEEGLPKVDPNLAAEQKLVELKACLNNQISQAARGKKDSKKLDASDLEALMHDFSAFVLPQESMKSFLRSHIHEKPLPGLLLNKKQTYYVQITQMMCEVWDSTATEKRGLLPDLRVNQIIKNLPNFGNVFDCPPNSAMSPVNKCSFMS